MTNEELIVMRDLLGDIIEANAERSRLMQELADKSDVNERQDKEYSSLCLECNQLRKREEDALTANEDLKARCTELMAERDDARRKLGALVMTNNNESVADIVADVRAYALVPLACDFLRLADRIETAHKREIDRIAAADSRIIKEGAR